MDTISSRAYTGASDLNLLVRFAQSTTAARWPGSTYMKAGDVVWNGMPGSDPTADICLWFDHSELVAYAWFEPPLHFEFDILPTSSRFDPLAADILAWAEHRRSIFMQAGGQVIPKAYAMFGSNTVSATVLDSDQKRISILKGHGYQRVDRFRILYSRTLTDGPIEQPRLDGSLRLRHVTDADLDARAEVHRAAWAVWGPSSWSAEACRQLRAAPLYDPELDVVLEDSTHRFVSYCLGWIDAENGIGHFEPVGCRPALPAADTRAVIIEAMRRMKLRGMHTALVNAESVNDDAVKLYSSCRFAEVDRAYYTKHVVE